MIPDAPTIVRSGELGRVTMRGVRALTLVAILTLTTAGCSLFCGRPRMPNVDPERSAYWLWYAGGSWHLRVTTAGEMHRFQGTLTGKTSIRKFKLGDKLLRDHAAVQGTSLQFDFERKTPATIDFRLSGPASCLQLDVYFDGIRRIDRVYIGRYARAPLHLPFDVCPPR